MSDCIHIDKVVKVVESSGNSISEISTGWSKVKKVVHMKEGLTIEDKESILSLEIGLRYWQFDATPHNSAERGFTCDHCAVSISFPRRK